MNENNILKNDEKLDKDNGHEKVKHDVFDDEVYQFLVEYCEFRHKIIKAKQRIISQELDDIAIELEELEEALAECAEKYGDTDD